MPIKKNEVCLSHDFATILPLFNHEYLVDLFSNFKKLISKVEYESVINGDREVSDYWMRPQQADKQIEFLSKDHLVFLPCARTKLGNKFTHELREEEKLDSPNSIIYGTIAKDLDTAEEFVTAFKKHDEKKMGSLHGYPDCCIATYSERPYDPIYEMSKETFSFDPTNDRIVDYNFLLLQHLRYWGPKIVPWFPCHLKCHKSEIFAEDWLDGLTKENKDLTKKIIKILEMPSEWSLLNRQVIVKHPLFIGYATSYWHDKLKKVVFDPQNEGYTYTGDIGLRTKFNSCWSQ